MTATTKGPLCSAPTCKSPASCPGGCVERGQKAGPYEAAGVYQGSEFFDTSGTPNDFCPSCEHAPCVAGFRGYCENRPRFFVRRRLRDELLQLVRDVGGWDTPLTDALRAAIFSVGDTSWSEGHHGDRAYEDLVRIFMALRSAKEAQS